MSKQSNGTNPPKWWEVYQGDKENRFFKELARSGNTFRTTAGLVKSAKLTTKEVEAIVAKYQPLGIIVQHSSEPGKYCYWELAPTKSTSKGSISKEDQKKRVKEAVGNSAAPALAATP